jgi:hypothetical protein
MKLDLKNVTAVGFFGMSPEWGQYRQTTERIDMLLTYMLKTIDFNKIVFVSSYKPNVDGVEHVPINPITHNEYNKWCLHELNDYVNTDYCLSFQDDGFPINPELWDDIFFNYDYVGAPCKTTDGILYAEEQIGGGGFTLRSKKLLEYTKTIEYDYSTNEDTIISLIKRNEIVNLGMKICPHNIARKFVVQNPLDENHTIETSFGFHSRVVHMAVVDELLKVKLLNLNSEVI